MRRAALPLFLTAIVCYPSLTATAAGAPSAVCRDGVEAQEARATLHGQVTDQQRAVIPGASVSVISEDTSVTQATSTNAQGSWTVPFLTPGPYTVTVSAPGFKVAEQRGIILQTSDIKQIDFLLEVGTESERVEVIATAPLID